MASTEEVLSFHESENEALEGSPVAQGDTNVKMSNELTATKSNTNLRKSKGSMTRLSGSNSSISKTRSKSGSIAKLKSSTEKLSSRSNLTESKKRLPSKATLSSKSNLDEDITAFIQEANPDVDFPLDSIDLNASSMSLENHGEIFSPENLANSDLVVGDNPQEKVSKNTIIQLLEGDAQMGHILNEEILFEGSDFGDADERDITLRLLTSPPPELSSNFAFVYVDYERDPDAPTVALTTALSRATSRILYEEQNTIDQTFLAQNLRPSTPTSAVAVEPKKSEDNGGSKESDISVVPESALEQEEIGRDELINEIRELIDRKDRLKAKNIAIQNRLGEYFKRKKSDDTKDSEKSVADHEARYANCLASLGGLDNNHDTTSVANQKIVDDYQTKLSEKNGEVGERTNEFVKYKRAIALQAENSRTGKPLPLKFVEQLEALDIRKDQEVNAVRLENIKLRNKLRRHEQLLRQKEELADGLHLIDFEQLKIENQTYNEKIEERNEELLKLRKKITNVVQILTHVKEKLQFVQAENIHLRKDLRGLDDEVSHQRDTLPVAKQERDSLRNSSLLLRHKNGLVGNVPLLRDYENKVDECDELNNRINQLRSYHSDISADILSLKRRIKKGGISAALFQ